MDWSTIAAIIALVVSVVSPIATAIINIKNKSKILKLQQITLKKIKILGEYLRAAASAISSADSNGKIEDKKVISDYVSAHYETMLYVSPPTIHNMEHLLDCFTENNWIIDQKNSFIVLGEISALMTVYDLPQNEVSSITNPNIFLSEYYQSVSKGTQDNVGNQ